MALNQTPNLTQSEPVQTLVENNIAEEDLSLSDQDRERFESVHKKALSRLHVNAQKPITYNNASQHGKEYMHRIQNPERVSPLTMLLNQVDKLIQVEKRQQWLDFSTAKAVTLRLFERELARSGKKMHFTVEQESKLNHIIKYFIGDPSSEIPLHKGIFLYGNVGVGKDWIFRVMDHLCKLCQAEHMRFDTEVSKTIVAKVKDTKNTTYLSKLTRNLLIQDLGEEHPNIKVFGNEEKVMDELFSHRYILFDRFGTVTHATSNADVDDLMNYGSRIYDRILDMFHPIHLPGDSKRG